MAIGSPATTVYYKGERMGEARPVDLIANDRKPTRKAHDDGEGSR